MCGPCAGYGFPRARKVILLAVGLTCIAASEALPRSSPGAGSQKLGKFVLVRKPHASTMEVPELIFLLTALIR